MSTDAVFNFFALPGEIRNAIYEQVANGLTHRGHNPYMAVSKKFQDEFCYILQQNGAYVKFFLMPAFLDCIIDTKLGIPSRYGTFDTTDEQAKQAIISYRGFVKRYSRLEILIFDVGLCRYHPATKHPSYNAEEHMYPGSESVGKSLCTSAKLFLQNGLEVGDNKIGATNMSVGVKWDVSKYFVRDHYPGDRDSTACCPVRRAAYHGLDMGGVIEKLVQIEDTGRRYKQQGGTLDRVQADMKLSGPAGNSHRNERLTASLLTQ